MTTFKTLPSLALTDDERHAFVNGIFDAITHDMPDLIKEYNLPTSNGSPLFRWNFINRNIPKNLGGNFDVRYARRGSFSVMLLFERELGFTFSIMSENNFSGLRKNLPDKIHYIEGLAANNDGYDVSQQQLKFEGIEKRKRDPSVIEKLKNELLQFEGIIKNHFLILFNYSYNQVLSVRVVLPSPELDVVFEEDWSSFLKKPYVPKDNSILCDLSFEDEEPLVSLKESNKSLETDAHVTLPKEPDLIIN